MTEAVAKYLSDGARLHLQHGPIDLIIGADGPRDLAFQAAQARFATVLDELVGELSALRLPLSPTTLRPVGSVAHRMHAATMPLSVGRYLTRMAAVAGAVADEVLAAMTTAADLPRAYVNNGGDIALHLGAGQRYSTGLAGHDGHRLGQVAITHDDPIRGIATSGRHGRSLSRGIADSVTVLARNAAQADAAATLIANAVDLPEHPAITRRPANMVRDDSDLDTLPVVTHCASLQHHEVTSALAKGAALADALVKQGRITAAALFLQDDASTTGPAHLFQSTRTPEHA